MTPRVRRDRVREALYRELGQRDALNPLLRDSDRIERNIDGPRLAGYAGGVVLDGLLVEGVDRGSFGPAAGNADLGGQCLGHGLAPRGHEEARPLTSEGARQGAADGTGGTIDDRILVHEKHRILLRRQRGVVLVRLLDNRRRARSTGARTSTRRSGQRCEAVLEKAPLRRRARAREGLAVVAAGGNEVAELGVQRGERRPQEVITLQHRGAL